MYTRGKWLFFAVESPKKIRTLRYGKKYVLAISVLREDYSHSIVAGGFEVIS